MKPIDIFKLLVRAVGVYLLYQVVVSLPDFLIALSDSERFPGQVFVKLAGLVGATVWFLFGAPPILKLAYPEPNTDSPTRKIETVEKIETGPPCIRCGKPTSEASKICPSCGWTQP
jgi:hypothetical protein